MIRSTPEEGRVDALGRRAAIVWGVELALVAMPFIYYAIFIWRFLHPVPYPDAAAYLWEGPIGIEFFTGRSLTQRCVFTLCGAKPGWIAAVHLALDLATALYLLVLLRRPDGSAWNLMIALGLCVVYSSYTFALNAVVVTAEPIYLNLLLLFPCVLFLQRGRLAAALVLGVGLCFVFSKSVAPYACLCFLLCRIVASRRPIDRWSRLVFALLALASLASALVTARYDSAIHINMFNNVTQRIYPDAELTRHFHEKYGMPTDPFIGTLAGLNVVEAGLLGADKRTRTWVLRPEAGELGTWIREKGQRSYLRALLLDDPRGTARWFRDAWRDESGDEVVAFIRIYLGMQWHLNDPNNMDSIAATGPGRRRGFLGFDPLVALRAALQPLGFGDLRLTLFYAILGMAVARTRLSSRTLPLAASALFASVPLFFVSYFGDAMEIERHVGPVIILNTLAAILMLGSLPGIVRAARATLPGAATRGRRHRRDAHVHAAK